MAAILSYPITYRGLTLQGQFDTAGNYIRANELNCYVVEQFDFSRLIVRDQRTGLHLDTGGLLGPATKQFRRLALRGSIRAETDAMLEDMAAALYAKFDIENAQAEDPQFRGEHVMDFWSPTDVAGYTDPQHEMFLARPVGHPQLSERRSTGLTMAYGLELVCADPRRYRYDITQVNFSTALGWTQSLPNWPDGMGYETYPYVLLNLSGIGLADFTITDDNTGEAFVLDLSAQTSDIAVDMQTMEIVRNSDGARRDYLRTSGPDSWLPVPPGGTSWTITNDAGVTDVSVAYRQARS